MANEIQRLYFGSQASPVAFGNAESGTFTLTYSGQTTASIAYNASPATITTELEALSNIGSGDVLVTATADGFTVEFQGALADTNVSAITASPSLKQKADTVSATTTTAGAADSYSAPSIGGGFTDGNDDLVFAQQTITFSPAPTQGSWTFDGNSRSYNEDFSGSPPSGWSVNGTPSGGTVTITKADSASGQSAFSYSVGSLEYLVSAGAYQVVTITTPDTPTEGSLIATLDGTPGAEFAYNDSAGAISGWTAGGSAGNWTYTRDTKASNVSASAAEGTTPLRKDLAIEIVTVQEGSAGGGASNGRINILTMGCG